MKNLIIIIAIFFPFFAQAQFQFGITSSYNVAASSSAEYMAPLNKQYAYRIKFEGHSSTKTLGLAARATFDNIFAAVEVTFRETKYEMLVEDFSEGSIMPRGGSKFTETTSAYHIPVSAGVKYGSMTFALGPYFNYAVDSTKPIEESTDILDKERKLSAGFHFDLGYNIGSHFTLFARYEKAFADVGNLHYFNGKKTKLESNLNYLSIGGSIYL